MKKEEILKQVYAGLNRNDIEAIFEFFDSEIERIEPAGYDTAGIWRGHEEVKAHFVKGRSTWAEGGCTPESFRVVGDKVIAFIYVRVRLKDKTEWLEGRLADVYTFKGDKIIQMRTFWESKEAVEWVETNFLHK